MANRIIFSIFGLFLAPTFAFGACSVANLTRCLDSACAINIGANPAARCQYCGSSAAGTPTKSTAMKTISAGASGKYNISDKELKGAPSDPGERYVWATKLCLKKVSDCTIENVDENYDPLIEKSCTAAGISAGFTNLAQRANQQKNQSSCSTDVKSCLVNEKRCAPDYSKCEKDSDFDKYFSECSVAATGCESFLSQIRSELITTRNSMIASADKILHSIVNTYQTNRNQKLQSAQNSCKDNGTFKKCVATVCNNNMPHQCDIKYNYEETLAEQLCEFYKIACNRLK